MGVFLAHIEHSTNSLYIYYYRSHRWSLSTHLELVQRTNTYTYLNTHRTRKKTHIMVHTRAHTHTGVMYKHSNRWQSRRPNKNKYKKKSTMWKSQVCDIFFFFCSYTIIYIAVSTCSIEIKRILYELKNVRKKKICN